MATTEDHKQPNEIPTDARVETAEMGMIRLKTLVCNTKFRSTLLLLAVLGCTRWAMAFYPSARLAIVQQSAPGTGSIKITFNGYSETVNYGQYSTPASIAAGLAASFSQDPKAALPRLCTIGICAQASGATVNFQLDGIASFGTVTVTTTGSAFTVDTTGWPTASSTLLTPSLDVVCTPNPLISGASAGCTATLPTNATGTVSFSIDGETSWTTVSVASGVASTGAALGGVSPGDHTVTAEYSGDSNYLPASEDFSISILTSGLSSQTIYSYDMSQSADYAANGNINSYRDSVNGTWALTYDQLNRLIGASLTPVSGAAQYFCWSYDAFGNRIAQAVSGQAFTGTNVSPNCQAGSPGATPSHLASYNTNNQLVGMDTIPSFPTGAYDAIGNLQMSPDGQSRFLYDAEGRLCGIVTSPISGGRVMTQYIYDAEGHRVAKGNVPLPGTTAPSCNLSMNQFAATNSYVIGPDGSAITEMDGGGNWVHTNLSLGGQLIATYADDNLGVHFHLTDWLGSRRVQANYLGVVEQSFSNMPFGEMPSPPSSDVTENHFTGKERDSESGLDYFGARYYGSNMGRFMSPDWAVQVEPVPYSKLNDPQTLNLYAYVKNNPIIGIDPDGHNPASFPIDPFDADPFRNMAAAEDQEREREYDRTQKQNPRQKWERANEKKVQKRIASFPAAPTGARMVLTDCTAKLCNYKLTGVTGTFYAYEHFANNLVSPSIPIGPDDYTTDTRGTKGGFIDDQITAVGLGNLDQHRFFTISPASTYDPNNQMFVMIDDAGHTSAYEHLYDAVANAPSYINGISTDYYRK